MAKIKICLDAGHYGKYNQSPAVKTYYESDMNWKLHLKLKAELEKYGIEVITTRKEQAKDMGLVARGKTAKGCNLFLSIHSNAVDSKVHEDVDYPVAYVPINGTGDKLGKRLSECVASTMGTKQKAECWSKKSTDGKSDWYSVIYGASLVGVPGIILEHSFHTNTRATKWLMVDSNLGKLAKAEAEVIANFYGLNKPVETPKKEEPKKETPQPEKKTIYRVQTGAYGNRTYANDHLNKVKKAGFDGWMEVVDGMYKIYAGSFEVKKNAENRLKQVKAKGFSAFIATKTI
jgi:N-acetylmuramoyl-L-alanine amidase